MIYNINGILPTSDNTAERKYMTMRVKHIFSDALFQPLDL